MNANANADRSAIDGTLDAAYGGLNEEGEVGDGLGVVGVAYGQSSDQLQETERDQ